LFFKILGDTTWISRNLQNVEDSIFGIKPAKHLNLDDNDFDMVYNNDDNPTTIDDPDIDNKTLCKKKKVKN